MIDPGTVGPIVDVRGLVKRYGDQTAVDGVSFAIEEGSIFGLLGPNGAGKTTAISMISCLIAPDEGDVVVDGHSVLGDSTGVRRALGVVPQEIALYPTLSAAENLRFWGRMYGLHGAALVEAVDYGLAMAGLEEQAKKRIETFSGGMKRRINIAAGILHRPKVLLMDEPTVGIDPQSRNHILDSVRELNRDGMTVLYTSHYMEEVELLCDRIAILDHGSVIAEGSVVELKALVGDEDRIRVSLGDADGPADPAADDAAKASLSAVQALASVSFAEMVGTTLEVLAPDAGPVLGDVIARVTAAGGARPDSRSRGAQPGVGVSTPDRQGIARLMRRAVDIALKDILVWLRDPSALGILLGMPAVLIVILGSALGGMGSGGSARIAVAIVNLDSRTIARPRADDQAADLEEAITGSKRIKALFQIQRNRNLEETTARVASGELAAALVIPHGFGADLGAGRPVKLAVLTDPGSETAAGIWTSVVEAVATRYSAASIVVRTTTEAALSSNSPALSNPGASARLIGYAIAQGARDDALDAVRVTDEIASGNLTLSMLDYYALSMTAMFLMFGAMFGAFSTVLERRERTMARMLASPTPRSAVIGGKMLGVFVLGVLQFLCLYVFTSSVLKVQWGADARRDLACRLRGGSRCHGARHAHRLGRPHRTGRGRYWAARRTDPGADRRGLLPHCRPAHVAPADPLSVGRGLDHRGLAARAGAGCRRGRCHGAGRRAPRVRRGVLRLWRVPGGGANVRRVWSIAALNLLQLFRNQTELVSVLVLPLLLTWVFGLAFGSGSAAARVTEIPFADADASRYSRFIAATVDESDSLKTVRVTEAEARRQVRDGDAAVAIIVARGFGEDVEHGREARVLTLRDPGSTEAQAIVQVVSGATDRLATDAKAAHVAASSSDQRCRRRLSGQRS